jgi:hypothetical protein
MVRLLLFIMIWVIAGVIALAKTAIGKVSGNEELGSASLKGEAKKVMDNTAKGISWMEKQWEESKTIAQSENEIDKIEN